MTPHERELVDDLFDRLAKLETSPRDPDAERAVIEGLRRAPNAAYALVQTALVQDEALKRADARIRELSGEGEPRQESHGFLDTMRNALMGGGESGGGGRTSVPSVGAGSPGGGPDPRWNQGGTYQAGGAQAGPGYAPGGGYGNPGYGATTPGIGGSFLGTAAASAAGYIGGALLLNSISGMFGHHGSAFASNYDAPAAASPWDNSAAGSDLARDAGLNDIGSSPQGGGAQSAGLFDTSDTNDDDFSSDVGDDSGEDFDGGGDSA
ncbi:MAG: DUF2076 domain-containing protein [Pseudolabrys sp.]